LIRYDYDLFVIGAGSGGVRAARVAAECGARVAIAEEDKVGGTCVLRGCVPKKLFVHSAHFAEALEDAVGFGWTARSVRFDWPTLRDNVAADVNWLSGVYVRNLAKSGAELIRSRAVVEDAHTIRLLTESRIVTARYVLVATGGRPYLDGAVPGIENAITSNEVFHLDRLPKRVLVFGGGYIAVEFAGVLNAFGVETTVLCRAGAVLRGFDEDIRKAVQAGMERRGITVIPGQSIGVIEKSATGLVAVAHAGRRFEVDQVLFAIGRTPNARGFGLEAAGVEIDDSGAIAVDEYSRTSVDNIYAVGDVTNRLRLTPVAIREGMAVADTLFGGRPTAVDYVNVPTAVFSQPEAGTVGLTEAEARERYFAVDIYRASFKPLQNRVAGRDERMMVKLVVDADTDRVVGFHAVGPGAGEMAQLVAIAVRMGATKADFDATVAVHPTQSEEIVTMRNPVERHRRAAVGEPEAETAPVK
jgi:glutathione reductase (NADPH)